MKIFKVFLVVSVFYLIIGNTELTRARDTINCLSTFKDVTADSPICFYTSYLDYQRVISGFDDLTYRESENLTRGQMAKFIVNAFQIPQTKSVEEDSRFPDVEADHTFFSYIHSLKKADIVSGYPDGNFKPDESVTRGQMLKFLANAIEYNDPKALLDSKVRGKKFFNDMLESDTFYTYLLKLYVATESESDFDRIIELPADLHYRPNDYITRGEMAAMVTNSMFYTDVRNKISLPQYSKLLKGIKSNETILDGPFEINHYSSYGLTVLSTSSTFDYLYQALNPPTVKETAETNEYEFIFNAGFFGAGFTDAGYSTEHAGLLKIWGIQYAPIKTEQDSNQLTHMITFNKKNNTLGFVHRNDYKDISSKDYIIFQTGPSVIMSNRAEKDNIFNSKNGRIQRPRTLMGMTTNKEKHFFIFRYNYSLNEIADIMLHLDQFEGKNLSVINLDGGSSSAFYSSDYPQYNFGTEKRLPNLIAL